MYTKKPCKNRALELDNGGEGGIRTLEQFDPLHTFQACSFSHSDTSPKSFLVHF